MPTLTDGSVTYTATGYSCDPCPGCGELCTPGQLRRAMPHEWYTYHAQCWPTACRWCAEDHEPPHDGRCLL